MVVGVGKHQVEKDWVAKHQGIEGLEREEGKRDVLARGCFDLAAFRFGHRPAPPSRQSGRGMDGTTAQHLDDGVVAGATGDDLFGDIEADLAYHAEDVPLGGRGLGTHNEVGTTENVEVRGVVGHIEGRVEELTNLLGSRRRLDLE